MLPRVKKVVYLANWSHSYMVEYGVDEAVVYLFERDCRWPNRRREVDDQHVYTLEQIDENDPALEETFKQGSVLLIRRERYRGQRDDEDGE